MLILKLSLLIPKIISKFEISAAALISSKANCRSNWKCFPPNTLGTCISNDDNDDDYDNDNDDNGDDDDWWWW